MDFSSIFLINLITKTICRMNPSSIDDVWSHNLNLRNILVFYRKELSGLLSNMATRVKVVLFVRKPCKWVEDIKRMSTGDSRIVEIG